MGGGDGVGFAPHFTPTAWDRAWQTGYAQQTPTEGEDGRQHPIHDHRLAATCFLVPHRRTQVSLPNPTLTPILCFGRMVDHGHMVVGSGGF